MLNIVLLTNKTPEEKQKMVISSQNHTAKVGRQKYTYKTRKENIKKELPFHKFNHSRPHFSPQCIFQIHHS